jgi:hypothetical protein
MGKLSSAGTKVAKTAPRDETQLRKSAKLERDNRKLVRDLAQSATG